MKKITNCLADVLMYIVAALLAVLVILATVQVVTRYFVSVQIIWIEEVSIYLVTWIAAFGIPWMWLRQGHIKMDVLSFVLPPRVLRFTDYLVNAAALVAAVGVIYVGITAISVNSGYVLSVINMDEGMRYYPVLVAGILLLLSSALVLGNMIQQDRGKKSC